jgi:hypothetical protein
MSATAVTPGLTTSEWGEFLRLLDKCSEEQLDEIRNFLNAEKKEEPMAAKTDVQPELFPEKSQAMAMELWDAMKGPEDVFAAELPEETLTRITIFAKEIRNRTLDEISAAVERAYSKFTETVVADIRKQKE